MAGIDRTAHAEVDATPAACFALLEDFERYPEWYPFIDGTEILERDAQGRAQVVQAVTRLAVKSFRYALAYERGPGVLSARRVRGDFKRIELEWRIAERPGGGAAVTYRLTGDAGWALDRLLAPVRGAAGRELVDEAVEALAARLGPIP